MRKMEGCSLDRPGFFQTPEEEKNDRLIQLVSFKLGEEEFGIDILKVREIIKYQNVTKIPKSPPFVKGIINLRGSVIPVIDLRARFELPDIEPTKETRIMVVEIDKKIVGFVVDSVSEVLRINASVVEPPPSIAGGIGAEYIRGVGKLQDRLLIMLDLEAVLSKSEKEMLETVQSDGRP